MRIPERKVKPGAGHRISRGAVEFQPDALAIELEPLPIFARLTLMTVLAIITSAVIWSAFADMDRVVVAQGRLITRDPLIVLQPLEKSVIRKLPVRVGDIVRAGDEVAVLDPTFAAADLSASKAELSSLAAKAARLQAELRDFAPLADDERISAENLDVARRIIKGRAQEYKSRIVLFDVKERKTQKYLQSLKLKHKLVLQSEKVVGEMVAMQKELKAKGVGRRDRLLSAMHERLKAAQELADNQVQIDGLTKELATVSAERDAFKSEWWRKVDEELATVWEKRHRIANALAKAERRTSLVELRTPVDAIVLERAQLSVGSIAESARPIVWLVPLDAKIEGEVEIPSKDIAMIKTKNQVKVKLEAFPFQKFGILLGIVSSLAPSTSKKTKENKKKIVYIANISLSSERLSGMTRNIKLIPGMVITAEIIVGKRTVLSYFLYPLIRMFDEFGGEPS